MRNKAINKHEVIRFMIVGGGAALVHYLLYISLLAIDISYSIAYTISFVANLACNFFGSNYITFKTKPTLKRAIKFLISNAINFLIHMSIFNISVRIGCPEKLAPIIAYTIAFPLNFILIRLSLKGLKKT